MVRKMEIVLEKRGVHCVAELLDERAPKTCEAMWRAMPGGGQAYHAKYPGAALSQAQQPRRGRSSCASTMGCVL